MGLAHGPFDDLPGGRAGQVVGEGDGLRDLVLGQPAPQVREDFRAVGTTVGLQHDDGVADLAPDRVRHADHRALAHRRVTEECVLHFGRVHVLPAGDEHVLDPVDDVGVALRVRAGDVARPQPSVAGEGRRGVLGAAPVAGHHVGPLDEDLTALSGPRGTAVGEDDPGVGEEVRDARRARLRRGLFPVEEEHAGGCLGHAVPLAEGQAAGEVPLDGACRDRCAAAAHGAQAGQVGRLPARMGGHRVVHRGHPEHVRHPPAFDDVQHRPRVESFQQHDPSSLEQGGQTGHVEPGGVEQRGDDQSDFVAGQVGVDEDVDAVPGDVGVRQHRALGTARRPGGVHDDAGIVRGDGLVQRTGVTSRE